MIIAKTHHTSNLNPKAPEFFPSSNYHDQHISQPLAPLAYGNQLHRRPPPPPPPPPPLQATFSSPPTADPSSFHHHTSTPYHHLHCTIDPYYNYHYYCHPTHAISRHVFLSSSSSRGSRHDFMMPLPLATELRPCLAGTEQSHFLHEAHQEEGEGEGEEEEESVTGSSRVVKGGGGGGGGGGGEYRKRCFGTRRFRGYRKQQESQKSSKKEFKAKIFNGNTRNLCANYLKINRVNRPVIPVRADGQSTTVMIRNIPNKYSRELLMEYLDKHCVEENQKALHEDSTLEKDVSAFDFLYLPMDFKKRANKGYAFVNFTSARAAWKFHLAAHNKTWDLFQSNKVCEIASARLQGKEELVRHFERSNFECELDEYLPVCFSPARDGSRETVRQRIVGTRFGKKI